MDRTDEDRAEVVVVAHLVDGSEVQSKPGPITRAEAEMFKKFLADQFADSGGWQVNLELDDGWAIFPKASVLYLSMHSADAVALLHDQPA